MEMLIAAGIIIILVVLDIPLGFMSDTALILLSVQLLLTSLILFYIRHYYEKATNNMESKRKRKKRIMTMNPIKKFNKMKKVL